MATPRKLENYPSEFRDIFKRAVHSCYYHGEGTLIAFPGSEEARRFRQRLYAYRAALLQNPSFDPYMALLAPTARISIRYTSSGCNLLVNYPLSELSRIREALEKAK